MIEKPIIIIFNSFLDERGELSFVNDLKFDDIKRFYIISNNSEMVTRAWQGHKIETKYFCVIRGTFLICLVKIDNWHDPSDSLPVQEFVLSEKISQVLITPPGYANGMKALQPDLQLLVFSDLLLEESKEDNLKYTHNLWYN